jgi:hypothetical protein
MSESLSSEVTVFEWRLREWDQSMICKKFNDCYSSQ